MRALRKGKGKEGEGQDWLCKAELSLKIWSPQSDRSTGSPWLLGDSWSFGAVGLLDRTSEPVGWRIWDSEQLQPSRGRCPLGWSLGEGVGRDRT